MAVNLSYGQFALLPEAVINDSNRDGGIILEYFQVDVTIGTNEGDVEVPTALAEVLGVINLCYNNTFASGDKLLDMTTDGVITTSAVTVRVSTVSLGDGAHTIRGFLVGKGKAQTVLFNDPTD